MTITFLGALAGGLLALLSPCSAVILPSFFSYAFTDPGKLIHRTLMFFLGLLTTLVPLGALAGVSGAFVSQHRLALVNGASVLIIAMGIIHVAGWQMPSMVRRQGTTDMSAGAVYLLGTAYGLSGTCTGPILGSVLSVAAIGGDALRGSLLLAVFGLGMAFPLFVLSAVWRKMPWIKVLVRPRGIRLGRLSTTWTGLLGGLLSAGLGVFLLLTQGTATLGAFLRVDQQAALENAVMAFTRGIPDTALLLSAAFLLATAVFARWRRRGHPGRGTGADSGVNRPVNPVSYDKD